jgi:hypothetical protein
MTCHRDDGRGRCIDCGEFITGTRTVTVKVKDGMVVDVSVPQGVHVVVRDYDVENAPADADHLRDEDGKPFVQDEWSAPRLKQPGCEHQFAHEPNCVPAFRNSYHCDDCDVSWTDTHSCACDDECPECGTAYTPAESEEVAPCACEYL